MSKKKPITRTITPPQPIDIKTSLARLQGDHYIMSLNDQLNYAGYGFGDQIRVRIDFIRGPKK